MKRLLSFAIAVMLAGQAWAQSTFWVKKLKYNITDNKNNYVWLQAYESPFTNDLTIPSNPKEDYIVVGIARRALQDFSSLKSVTIPETVNTIGGEAFLNCKRLATVTIGSSVSSIEEGVFRGCISLTNIIVHTDNYQYSSQNGVLFNSDETTIVCYPAGKSEEFYIIPNSVESIMGSAFSDCINLTSVFIPSTVTFIGENAFNNCVNATLYCECEESQKPSEWSTNWNSSNCTVKWGCKIIKVATNNNEYGSVSATGYAAETEDGSLWYENGATAELTATPNSDYLFVKWSDGSKENPQQISVTESKTYSAEFQPKSFVIDGLKYEINPDNNNVTVSANSTDLSGDIRLLDKVTYNNVEYTVTSISDGAFSGCSGLTDIFICDSVTSIGSSAFSGCSGLTWVVIPNSTESIGSEAFLNCTSLETVTIGPSVSIIGESAFAGCSSLTEIHVEPDNNQYTSQNGVLFNSDKTTIVCYPASKTGETYIIPNSVESIENSAFSSCSGLTSVFIPNSVESIGSSAFEGCSNATLYCECEESQKPDGWNTDWNSGNCTVKWGSKILKVAEADQGFVSATGYTLETEDGSLWYEKGATAKLTATPFSDYIFVKWSDESTENPYEFSVTESKTYSAEFRVKSFVIDELKYETNSNSNNVTVSANSKDISGDIVIPDKVTFDNVEYTVTSIFFTGFYDCQRLISVVIPNSVTSIGEFAFSFSTSLETVTIGNSVTSIGESAFKGCCGLTEINVGSNNTQYSSQNGILFNKGKTAIILYPASKTDETYNIPNSVERIKSSAFRQNYSLTSVTIPNSVKAIGSGAFILCYNSILFYCECEESQKPDGWQDQWKTDDCTAKWGCKIIKVATNNNEYGSVSATGFAIETEDGSLWYEKGATAKLTATPNSDYRFVKWSDGSKENPRQFSVTESKTYTAEFQLNSFVVDELTFVVDGLKYEINPDDNNVSVSANSTELSGDIVIPDKVTCNNVEYTVTSVPSGAFSGCSGLTSVTVPNSVTGIGKGAFSGCSSLQTITLPFVGDKAHISTDYYQYPFGYIFGEDSYEGGVATTQNYRGNNNAIATANTTYYIPSTLKTAVITGGSIIQDGAFKHCSNPKTVFIPNSVTSIPSYTFQGIRTIVYAGTATGKPWGAATCGIIADEEGFIYGDAEKTQLTAYIGSAANVTIPNTVTSIGVSAFYGCNYVTSLTIPSSVTDIDYYAFSNCNNIATLSFNTNAIGTLFKGSKSIKNLIIGEAVTKIADYAFYGCDNIETLTFNTNAIGDEFANSKSLTTINVGDAVTTIPELAFSNCAKLTTINGGESVTTIENGAFDYCNGLKSIPFASSLTTIGEMAFYNCDGLESITFGNSLTTIGEEAFRDCSALVSVNFGNSLTTIGEGAFRECGNLTNMFIPKSVTKIDEDAFVDCSNLTLVTIPKSVTSIGGSAFYNCKKVNFFCGPESEPSGWFYWNPGKRPVVWGVDTDKEIWYVTVTSGNSELGSVKGSGYVVDGSTITITATPVDGYHFSNWSDSNTDNPRSFTVTGDISLTATFEAHASEKVAAVAPTCTETGLTEGTRCSVCKTALVAQQVVPATGHTEVVDGAVAATCTESGLTEGKHCSVCKATLVAQQTVPATGHTEIVDKAVAATCTEPGLTEGKHCSICGENLVAQQEIPATGHTEVVDTAVEPTCTELGLTEGKHCSVCEKTLVAQETVAALGHTVVVDAAVEPTCTELGLTEGKHCSVCEKTLVAQETVAALGHTVVVDAAIEPTCTESGITEGSHCSVCGETIVEQKVIPAQGHKEVIDEAVAATTTSTGLTEGSHCSVCGKVFVEQTVIPKLDNGGGNTELPAENTDFTFSKTGDNTVEVSGYTGSGGTVAIPQTVTIEGVEYSVIAIADEAFQGNSNLAKVVIPNTIYTIGTDAFNKCENLEIVEISSSVNTIKTDAFTECPKLTAINVDPENEVYFSIDGVLYNTDASLLLQYPAGKTDTKFEIPNSVEVIGYKAFDNCTNLTSVTIPNSVSYIYWAAFWGCTNLESVVIPNSVTTIHSSAFGGCTGLKEIYIPESVEQIEGDAFSGCTNATFYCESEVKDNGWEDDWCPTDAAVVWEYDMSEVHTAVSETVASMVNIYAHGKSIIVENAYDEIFVYDVTGRLICKDANLNLRAEITINNTGVYIVKSGSTVKRVIVN